MFGHSVNRGSTPRCRRSGPGGSRARRSASVSGSATTLRFAPERNWNKAPSAGGARGATVTHRPSPQRVAFGTLDQDDLGTTVGEQLAEVRAGDAGGEVQHDHVHSAGSCGPLRQCRARPVRSRSAHRSLVVQRVDLAGVVAEFGQHLSRVLTDLGRRPPGSRLARRPSSSSPRCLTPGPTVDVRTARPARAEPARDRPGTATATPVPPAPRTPPAPPRGRPPTLRCVAVAKTRVSAASSSDRWASLESPSTKRRSSRSVGERGARRTSRANSASVRAEMHSQPSAVRYRRSSGWTPRRS